MFQFQYAALHCCLFLYFVCFSVFPIFFAYICICEHSSMQRQFLKQLVFFSFCLVSIFCCVTLYRVAVL